MLETCIQSRHLQVSLFAVYIWHRLNDGLTVCSGDFRWVLFPHFVTSDIVLFRVREIGLTMAHDRQLCKPVRSAGLQSLTDDDVVCRRTGTHSSNVLQDRSDSMNDDTVPDFIVRKDGWHHK